MSGCSMPHLPPPPPALPPSTGASQNSSEKKKLYQTIGSNRSPVEGDYTEPLLIIRHRESSFSRALHWTLVNTYVPSLIQDGPQCGLVALWMAAHLLRPSIDMGAIFQAALARGFTAQGEMFSARNMALLAEEVCGCKAELLSGRLSGRNATRIIKHLWNRQPVLIPYDEDYNHEPCQRSGHKAHWAVASGVLLGMDQGDPGTDITQPDPTLPWIHLLQDFSSPSTCPSADNSHLKEVYILAKQGKSLRYQLWNLDDVIRSNEQLRALDPQRCGDGTMYVLPQGGVEAGLAGQAVLLHVRTLCDSKAHKMDLNSLQ
ncbi:actin maturation protease isoform X2 [Corythoichthys intestinalis]|nr:actin maturation protease isoform X2 [Corythoichthys intestinalis]XP_057693976.1 actin maturation protease isoform X2 [Corythoichthys intestinalis]XP_057693977.1 actin maturation protease isoform X2 [Corythoichthys intestinalis]XP_061797517.1 actin maturation protease-like [Nerophis lumbriciformis]